MFNFWGVSPHCFPQRLHLLRSHQRCAGSPLPTSSPALLSVGLLAAAVRTGEGCCRGVSVCISPVASDLEHLFLCPWAPCVSSLEKRLLRSSGNFLIALSGFPVWSCMRSS